MIPRPNLYDYLKIIALITMIVDHVGLLFFPDQELRRIIGRAAFPLFLFLVGYNHSFRRRKELWIRGIILQCLLWVGYIQGRTDIRYVNILLAIGCVRIILQLLQTKNSMLLEGTIFFLAIIGAWRTYTYIDYGTMSIVFALVGYWARSYGGKRYIYGICCGAIVYHMLFMVITRGYTPTLVFYAVGCFLLLSLCRMSTRNSTLRTHNTLIDTMITHISSYALLFYVGQAGLLSLVYLLQKWGV